MSDNPQDNMQNKKQDAGATPPVPDKAADGATATGGDNGGFIKKKHVFHMPSAYVIVYIALLVVVLISYFVPVSVVDPSSGDVVYNATFAADGSITQGTGPQPMGFWDVIMAPIKGFQSASDVGIALLIAGGFLNVLTFTGGLNAGIGRLLKRVKGNMLIALMMLVFALMGTVFGLWEEIVAFSLVIVPMFTMAGYDVMTALAIMFIGATVGNMASVVNPFSTGAAVSAIHNPDLTLGSGIVLRGVIFVVLYIVSTLMVIRYASAVKKNPDKSVLKGIDVKVNAGSADDLPELTGKRLGSLIVFICVVALLIIGYIPWGQIGGQTVSNIVNAPILLLEKIPVFGDIIGAAHITPFGEWGFNEFSVLFLVGAFALLIVNRMKEDEFIDHFIGGASDLLGVVLVLAIARGISIVMGDATQGMSVTFVYWISSALSNVPLWIFGVFAVLAYIGIGVFLQSTSGVAGISMPILGAVAAALFATSAIGAAGGQIILIAAFNLGINFMCLIYPDATNLGTLHLFNVPFGKYVKFMLFYTIPLLILGTLIIAIAPYIGLVM